MSGWNTGPAGPPPKDLQAELREAIEKSIGMRERDQHDAMIDFGEGKITKEQLQALSDESRKLFTEDLLALFQAHQQELLSELLDEMHPYRTIESMRFLIERKIGELNG